MKAPSADGTKRNIFHDRKVVKSDAMGTGAIKSWPARRDKSLDGTSQTTETAAGDAIVQSRGWRIVDLAWLNRPPESLAAAIYSVVAIVVGAALVIGVLAFFFFG